MPESLCKAILADVECLYRAAKELPIKCRLQTSNLLPPMAVRNLRWLTVGRIYQHLYSHLLPLRSPLVQLQKEAAQNSKIMKDFFVSSGQAMRDNSI